MGILCIDCHFCDDMNDIDKEDTRIIWIRCNAVKKLTRLRQKPRKKKCKHFEMKKKSMTIQERMQLQQLYYEFHEDDRKAYNGD